jgi:hypothetical protein
VVVLVDLDELVGHWTLLEDERELVAGKQGPTRLGFALLLKFYTRAGRFPSVVTVTGINQACCGHPIGFAPDAAACIVRGFPAGGGMEWVPCWGYGTVLAPLGIEA